MVMCVLQFVILVLLPLNWISSSATYFNSRECIRKSVIVDLVCVFLFSAARRFG